MEPVKIIYDTDLGGDCDDAGALALLHRLCDRGEAELLAVTHCYSSPYYAGAVDAINTFYGRQVPVGINYAIPVSGPANHAGALAADCPNRYPPETFGTERAAPDTLTVLRQTLAAAGDHNVTLVVTGALSSMAKLMRSGPDDISPLSGRELADRKLRRTVVMGGRFFGSWPMYIGADGRSDTPPVTWEWNIRGTGYADACCAIDSWPGELVFSSYEIGSYIITLRDFPSRARPGDPAALAYAIHNHGAGRSSWDLTAMLEAVRPGRYWNCHEPGRITVDEELVTHWTRAAGGRHTYLLPKTDYEEIRQIIDDLVMPEQ